jgi:hypothetical protein
MTYIDIFEMLAIMNVFTLFIFSSRCVAFFMDADRNHYVGLQWYAEVPIPPRRAVLEFPCLELAREDRSSSYSILPADCIVNGAFLMPRIGKMWALQSPREVMEYIRNREY